MNIKTSPAGRFLAKTLFAAALTVGSVSHMSDARASGIPVVDIAAITNAIKNYYDQYFRWIDTAKNYAETTAHYAAQVAQWKTQFDKLTHLNFELFTMEHQFTEVDANFGADVECPGPIAANGLAGVLDTALNKLVPDMNGDVVAQQHDLCVMIVQAKNGKYNSTVHFLNSLKVKAYELAATKGLALTTSGEIGNTTGLLAQLEQFNSTLATSKTDWESEQKQIDVQIDMLLTMQAHLSRRAMKGSPNVIGTVVNAAALKEAFK
jgi:hypothetical protein